MDINKTTMTTPVPTRPDADFWPKFCQDQKIPTYPIYFHYSGLWFSQRYPIGVIHVRTLGEAGSYFGLDLTGYKLKTNGSLFDSNTNKAVTSYDIPSNVNDESMLLPYLNTMIQYIVGNESLNSQAPK